MASGNYGAHGVKIVKSKLPKLSICYQRHGGERHPALKGIAAARRRRHRARQAARLARTRGISSGAKKSAATASEEARKKRRRRRRKGEEMKTNEGRAYGVIIIMKI